MLSDSLDSAKVLLLFNLAGSRMTRVEVFKAADFADNLLFS